MVKPVLVYGCETWAVKQPGTWERKTLRVIYGPVVEQGIWGIRSNQELREILNLVS
jgi:hypothetical protein